MKPPSYTTQHTDHHDVLWLTDPAAVVHAAQHRDLLHGGGPGAQADRAGRGGARRPLRVSALQPGSHDEGVWVVSVPLHQQVHVPLTVDQ